MQGGEWANEYLTEPKNDWSEEISQAQHAATGDLGQAKGTADALEQTKALRDTLASSQDPKIRQSKFLQFVSKMSRGEIVLADNQVLSQGRTISLHFSMKVLYKHKAFKYSDYRAPALGSSKPLQLVQPKPEIGSPGLSDWPEGG